MTKIFAMAIMIALLIFCTVVAAGCYVIKGVKMSKLVGTYELTHYYGKEDYMTRDEMKLYVVINNNGSGYYVYQDKDTPLHCAEMLCRFTASQEDSSLYEYVELSFERNQSDWHKLGINGERLNSKQTKWKPIVWGEPLEIDYYIDVDFKKVSSKTDLSYVEQTFNTTLTALPLGVSATVGLYEFSYFSAADTENTETVEPEKPVYAYLLLNPYQNKATAYYMLKSNEQQVTEEYTCSLSYDGANYWVKIGNSEGYKIEWEGLKITSSASSIATDWLFQRVDSNVLCDVTERIEEKVAQYEQEKNQQSQ